MAERRHLRGALSADRSPERPPDEAHLVPLREDDVAPAFSRLVALLESASLVYTPAGVGQWLFARDPMLEGRTPINLLQCGELDRLEDVLRKRAQGAG